MSFKQSVLLLHNPVVFYVVGLVAVGNLLIYVYAQQFVCIGVFVLSALFTSFFTKNMIATLVAAIVICNLVCVSFGYVSSEGFKAKKKKKQAVEGAEKEAGEDSQKSKKKGGKMNPMKLMKMIPNVVKDVRKIRKDVHKISTEQNSKGTTLL